jgi:hypothetical protein
LGTITTQGVTCTACHRAITDEYFDVNGQSVCEACRTQLVQLTQTPRGWGLFAKAAVFGVVAAILGAILYYAVIAITDFEIGIVAIAIGYMVGWAIRKATASRGGRRYQVLALVLTYWAVGVAYTPLTFQGLAEQEKKEQAEKANAGATPEAAAPAAARRNECKVMDGVRSTSSIASFPQMRQRAGTRIPDEILEKEA